LFRGPHSHQHWAQIEESAPNLASRPTWHAVLGLRGRMSPSFQQKVYAIGNNRDRKEGVQDQTLD
jgi:hypothetical protein